MDDAPRLRAIEPLPIEVEGERMVALRDPRALSERTVFLSPPAFVLATLMNGRNSLDQIRDHFEAMSGVAVDLDYIRELMRELDQSLLLENAHFHREVEKIELAYRAETIRKPARQGFSYPSDPAELRQLLDNILDECPADKRGRLPTPPSAILIPHIDFERGRSCYAASYGQLSDVDEETTFVIIGTGHSDVRGVVSATRKDFETALGTVKVDQQLLDRLEAKSPIGLGSDELAHKQEHAIEFQAVFLQHIFGDARPFSIVPILVGSFAPYLESGRTPDNDGSYMGFVDALREAIEEHDKPVCVIGAVDLSHMGPRFGDSAPMDEERLADIRRRDLETLDAVVAGNSRGFYEAIAGEADERRFCGFPPIYTLLTLLEPTDGELSKYDQSVDESESLVSFCSLVFP